MSESTCNKPYWRDAELLKSAQEIGRMIANSNISSAYIGNADACTIIVLLANQYHVDPFFLAQHSYQDKYNRMAFTSTALEQILRTEIPSIQITEAFEGGWGEIRGKYKTDMNIFPYRVVPTWDLEINKSLSLTLKITYQVDGTDRTIEESASLSDIGVEMMEENTNWYVNPDRQMYFHLIRKIAYECFGFILNDLNNDLSAEGRHVNQRNTSMRQDSQNSQPVGNQTKDADIPTDLEQMTISDFLQNDIDGKYKNMPKEEISLLALNAAKFTLEQYIYNQDQQGAKRWGMRELKQLPLTKEQQEELKNFYDSKKPQMGNLGWLK